VEGGLMRVFIVYEGDGYDGMVVDKVFKTESAAVDYIIKEVFGSNKYYTQKTRAENEVTAKEYIDMYPVE
jgi:hypothetical protein